METGIIAERPGELKLEDLKTGVDNINDGYRLNDVISFINGLHTNVSLETGQTEGKMNIVFPVPNQKYSYSRALEGFNSAIYITDRLESKVPTLRAGGKRKVLSPVGFIAVISLNKDALNLMKMRKPEHVTLLMSMSKNELDPIIRKTIGKMPENWSFSPR